MAIAGAYAGPMFNLLVGLGLAMSYLNLKHKGQVGPAGHRGLGVQEGCLLFLNFGFLLVSLVTAIVIIPLTKFRITRRHGWFLVVLYCIYMGVSVMQQVSVFPKCLPTGDG